MQLGQVFTWHRFWCCLLWLINRAARHFTLVVPQNVNNTNQSQVPIPPFVTMDYW
jgi:hypothetical protein